MYLHVESSCIDMRYKPAKGVLSENTSLISVTYYIAAAQFATQPLLDATQTLSDPASAVTDFIENLSPVSLRSEIEREIYISNWRRSLELVEV